MTDRLDGTRVLVTSCDTYMGPPIAELFRDEGADVIADPGIKRASVYLVSCRPSLRPANVSALRSIVTHEMAVWLMNERLDTAGPDAGSFIDAGVSRSPPVSAWDIALGEASGIPSGLEALTRSLSAEIARAVRHGSLTTLKEKLIKIGARIVEHSRDVTFQIAEVAVSRELFARIADRIPSAVPAFDSG